MMMRVWDLEWVILQYIPLKLYSVYDFFSLKMNAQLSIPLNFEKPTKANFWPWHQSDQSGKKSDPAQSKLSLIIFSYFRSRLTSMNPFSDQDQLVALPKLLQLHSPEWIRIGSFKIRVLQRFESGDKFSNCQIRQECLLTERQHISQIGLGLQISLMWFSYL